MARLTASTEVETSYVFAYVDTGGGNVNSEDTLQMLFTVGDPASISFRRTSAPDLIANGYDTYEDTVIVYDSFGNPVPGAVVNYSLTNGSIVPTTDITDDNGEAGFEITAPTALGFGLLEVTSGSAVARRTVEYISTGVDTIVLNVSPRGLPADGVSAATVRAVVLDSTGSPASDGLTVNFSTDAGFIDPIGITSSGSATAQLIAADYADTATITARIGADTSRTICVFRAGTPAEINISISPDTTSVGSDLNNTVEITVYDSLGNPVAPGTIVNLSIANPDFGSLSEEVVAVDASGFAEVLFTPGTQDGICWISAQSGPVTDSAYIIIDAGTPYTMEFEVSDSAIYALGVGEIDQSTIYAYIFDRYGNPVADSTDVVFTVVDYPTGGLTDPVLSPPGTGLVSSTRYTFGGRATVTLRAGDKSGTVEVQANVGSGTIISGAPRITIRSGLATTISLSDSSCNIPGWYTDGLTNRITAIVSDENDNPVAPGTAVFFYTEEGVVTGAATTDANGFARATWFSADPRNDGDVWVYASTEGASGTVLDSTGFFMSGPPASIPSVTTLDASIDADGVSSTIVRATVLDINNNPVANGLYTLNFVTSKGTITGSPANITYTCGDAVAEAEATIVSQVCTQDISVGGPSVAQADITAYRGGVSNSTSMFFLHGSPNSDNSEIGGPESVGSGGTIPILVTVKDEWGNPIAGVNVVFSSSDGSVAPGTAASNESGYATASFTAPTVTDDLPVTIYATIGTGLVEYYSITVVAPKNGSGPTYHENDWELFNDFENLDKQEQQELLQRMEILPVDESEEVAK